MEATGRDGGAGGPSWSYRRRHEEIGSSSYTISSSSRSGTIVSSATYISGASRLSSGISMEAAALLELDLELKLGTPEPDEKDAEFVQAIKKRRKEIEEATLKETRMKHIESLVQEFFRGPSENHSILGGGGGGMSALKRWFLELETSWVLQLDVMHPPRGVTCHIWYWSQTLQKIMETIRFTESFFADHGHGVVGMPGISEEEEVERGKQATTSLDPVQFALFFQEAMSRMLVFVDVMFSESISISGHSDSALLSYLNVHSALSEALLLGIRLQFHSPPPAEIKKIEKEMVSLLSAKQEKAFEAIWNTLEETRTHALKSFEESSSGTQTQQGSADIHGATTLLMDRIAFLLCYESAFAPLISQAASLRKYVPQTAIGEAQPFVGMIAEMVSCLEEKLIAKSQSFRDKGLGLLFLLNNSNFILEKLQDNLSYIKVDLAAVISSMTRKVEHYTEIYIQVSWEPMLACLFNPTPLRLVRKYSPLSKFESEFQKIHITQMLWKVPDPKLKKRLRKAIIEKIVPGYTKYIEDSKVTNPKFTTQELEEMLQELFEG